MNLHLSLMIYYIIYYIVSNMSFITFIIRYTGVVLSQMSAGIVFFNHQMDMAFFLQKMEVFVWPFLLFKWGTVKGTTRTPLFSM